MRLPDRLILVVTLSTCTVAFAQTPTYNIGRPPSEEEIRAVDTTAGPRGKELPAGNGSAKEGEPLFAKKCVACHGQNGEGSKIAPRIIGGTFIYPFATTLWSIINTAMPRNPGVIGLREGTLTSDEVYALTAFILYKHNLIKEDDVMDAGSLPKIHIPNRDRRLDGQAPLANDAKR